MILVIETNGMTGWDKSYKFGSDIAYIEFVDRCICFFTVSSYVKVVRAFNPEVAIYTYTTACEARHSEADWKGKAPTKYERRGEREVRMPCR